MLQKFLFVGLGGSGGKTLRYLYEDLERRLAARRWEGPMPAAWQFLHIDVPTLADGTSPDLPAHLSRRSYIGLAPSNMTYRDLDGMLERQGQDVVRSVAAWRPPAARVGVNPTIGAGQFRAVGRIITAASLEKVVGALRAAVDELTNVDRNDELAQLSQKLTGDDSVGTELPPQVVVVSSIAGGSGAGSFLDVTDAIRNLGPAWCKETAGFFYLPDVFADVPDASKSGVSGNALASVSELMNAFWSDGSMSEEDDHALLSKAGLHVTPDRRGPRYPFLIGRSNGKVRFSSQNEVYRVTAKALASWITNPAVQDEFRVAMQGNWQNQAVSRPDATGLRVSADRKHEGLEVPFSALGFGSVGLGRERFADYARERLAAHALDHVLRGHVTEDVEKELITPEEAVESRARDVRHQFVGACGLMELGPEDNHILDAIRGGDRNTARASRLQQLGAEIQGRVTRPGDPDLPVAELQQLLVAAYRDLGTACVGELFEDDATRARKWVADVQSAVIRELSLLVGREGARVAEAVLAATIRELSGDVVPELDHDRAIAESFADKNAQRVASKFDDLHGKIPASSAAVREAIAECKQSVHASAEARLHHLVADIVRDLCSGLLGPLLEQLSEARRALQVEDQGTSQRPSETKAWTRRHVPRRLEPAQNEILLEGTDTYEAAFTSRLQATTGHQHELSALAAARAQVIAGLVPTQEAQSPTLIAPIGEWVPRVPELNLLAPRSAAFRIPITAESLLESARRWVWEPDTPMAVFVEETLTTYLDPEKVTAQDLAERLSRFSIGLEQALTSSGPLVELSPSREIALHGSPCEPAPIITPMPFPPGHPARDVVAKVFSHVPDSALGGLFTDEPANGVEITTSLAGNFMPAAVRSFYDPIASDWNTKSDTPALGGFWDRRRTRRLTEFVPMPPHKLRNVIQGWHVARLLDWVDMADPAVKPVRIWTPQGWQSFPFPLLGPPISDLRDLVPALLESFSLTLLADPAEGMPPYWQLEALGTAEPQPWFPPAAPTQRALEMAIRDGVALDGAPALPDALAGHATAEARATHLLDVLDQYQERYLGEIEGPTDAPTRALEISSHCLQAVGELRQRVAALRAPVRTAVI